MSRKYTNDELNQYSKKELVLLVHSLQEQMNQLNRNMENLIEQIHIANQQRFGRQSERLTVIEGQMSLFNEAEALSEEAVPEPVFEDVLPENPKKKNRKGSVRKILPVSRRNRSSTAYPKKH